MKEECCCCLRAFEINNITVTAEQLQQIVQAAITAVNAQAQPNVPADGGARPRV